MLHRHRTLDREAALLFYSISTPCRTHQFIMSFDDHRRHGSNMRVNVGQ